MQASTLQHQIDELLRRSRASREEGRYAESGQALRDAAELINQYADNPPTWQAEGDGK